LIRAHRAGVHVQVGIALLEGNSETSAFEQAANRRRCYAFAKGGNNTTGNKYILLPHRLSSGCKPYTSAKLGLLLQKDVGVHRIVRRIFIRVNVGNLGNFGVGNFGGGPVSDNAFIGHWAGNHLEPKVLLKDMRQTRCYKLPVVRAIQRLFVTAIVLGLTARCSYCASDEDVFKESVIAGKAAEQREQWYIFTEIAQAQAEHGHYLKALETAGLVDRYSDQLFIKLVSIRATKGGIAGARNMAAASTAKLKLREEEAIEIIQATTGDLGGARDTSRDLADKSGVLQEIGIGQIRSGDLEGALKTANEIMPGVNHDGLLYLVAHEFDKRGDHQRAREIMQRITTPDIEQTVPGMDAPPDRPMGPAGACEWASYDAKSGRFTEAYKLLEGTNCDCRSVAYIHEEARDATGAERAMRSCPNPADVSAGMAELAKRSAAKGEVQDALKFADAVHVTGANFEEGYLAPALRDIGRAWSNKDGNRALEWARSRPEGYQRAMALLGVAEGISASGSRP
jgi:hypothetical protein